MAELEVGGFVRIEPAANQYGQRKIFLGENALPKMAGQKWQAKNGEQNNTSKITIQENISLCARFEEFWLAYPNKVARKQCEAIWKRLNLDDKADIILTAITRWKACEQWQSPRFVPHPSTFLTQERWKDMPPAAEPKPLKKGEVRVRETTNAEREDARLRKEFFRLAGLPENNRKSDAEIWAIVLALPKQGNMGARNGSSGS